MAWIKPQVSCLTGLGKPLPTDSRKSLSICLSYSTLACDLSGCRRAWFAVLAGAVRTVRKGRTVSEQAIFPYRFASSVPLAAKERSTGSERNQHLNSVVACGGQRTPPFFPTTLEHSSVCCRYAAY